MSKNTRNPNPPPCPGRGDRDEPDYERFGTDWHMPEDDVNAALAENEVPESTPQVRESLPDVIVGRHAIGTNRYQGSGSPR